MTEEATKTADEIVKRWVSHPGRLIEEITAAIVAATEAERSACEAAMTVLAQAEFRAVNAALKIDEDHDREIAEALEHETMGQAFCRAANEIMFRKPSLAAARRQETPTDPRRTGPQEEA